MRDAKPEFPILRRSIHGKRLVYLDNAATTQRPASVIQAITNYYEQHNANPHRSIHTLASESTEIYEEARQKVAGFINAEPEEIIFTAGTTHGLNMAAQMLVHTLKAGDEVVITEMEHHSNLVPWQQLAEDKGVVLKAIKIRPDYLLDMEQAASIIGPKTKVVAVGHVSNVLGTINPLKELAKLAHDNGAIIVADGAQAVGHMPVDVKELDVDMYAFGAHKMYGPMGIGVLYLSSRHAKLRPAFFGGGMVSQVTLRVETRTGYTDAPARFEAGTPNVEGAAGLSAAIDFLNSLGMEEIARHEHALVQYAIRRLKEEGIAIIGPEKHRGGAISFVMDKVHPHDIAQVLDQEGVAVRAGHHCAQPLGCALGLESSVRLSVGVYNTEQDIDALIAGICKAREVFK